MSTSIHPLRLAALLAADGTALVVLRPDWSALVRDLRHPRGWVMQAGADQAAATLTGAGLWLCAALLGLAFVLTALTIAPGWLGALAQRAAARVVPAVVVRAAGATLGISMSLGIFGPALADAATVAPSTGTVSTSTSTGVPAWPVTATTPASPGSLVSPGAPLPGLPAATGLAGGSGESHDRHASGNPARRDSQRNACRAPR